MEAAAALNEVLSDVRPVRKQSAQISGSRQPSNAGDHSTIDSKSHHALSFARHTSVSGTPSPIASITPGSPSFRRELAPRGFGLSGFQQPFSITTSFTTPSSINGTTSHNNKISPPTINVVDPIRRQKSSVDHIEPLNAPSGTPKSPKSTVRFGGISSPTASAAVMSSIFLRRKANATAQFKSPLVSTTIPQQYYFQDAKSESTSQRETNRPDETHSTIESSNEPSSSNSAVVTDESIPTSELTAEQDEIHPPHTALPIEKLGDLSREDEYDFAILLKPSKIEEGLDDDTAALIVANALEHSEDTSGLHPIDLPIRKPVTSARQMILQRITRTGLHVKRLLSLDGKQTLLKVKASSVILEQEAERMKIRKQRQYDGIWMEFSIELRQTFKDYNSETHEMKFRDSEKQAIIYSLLTSDPIHGRGAGLNEFCPLKSKYILQMFPLHSQDLTSLRQDWVTYWRYQQHERISCQQSLQRIGTHVLKQPIDQVAYYYGEKIAYYFAWCEMYTRWLIIPSIAGILLFILQVHSQTLDHPLIPFYALFLSLWTTAFLIAWKRQAATLAYQWGTLGYEDIEMTRPEFYGDPAMSTDLIKRYPVWKRYLKYTITIPSVFICIGAVLSLTFIAFTTRDRLQTQSIVIQAKAQALAKTVVRDLEHGLTLKNLSTLRELSMDWHFWFYFLITPLLYGFFIPLLDYVFTIIAKRMNDWENHQTESAYANHLILKIFCFRFVHVFASLYYYAFLSDNKGSLLKVAIQLASFMISDQIWRNVIQTFYPFIQRTLQSQRKKKATQTQFHTSTVFNQRGHTGPSSNAIIHQQCVRLEQASDRAWEEADMREYEPFEDYTEMLIQFGYVTFFSIAFPLAPLLALMNNIFEIRMDAFKLCHAMKRPIARKASGIGVWFHVLQVMSILAVLTNCLHIALTTTQMETFFPLITSTQKVWLVFCIEHFILLIKVWMMLVIPSMPRHVMDNIQRERDHAKLESARAIAKKVLIQN